MLHRQLRTVLEEIFGADYVSDALEHAESAQAVIHESPHKFKDTVLGFQRLNYRDEQTTFARAVDREFGFALICALLDTGTRELVAELGLSYI